MTVTLSHTIVPVRDKETSARFLADTLGLSTAHPWPGSSPVALDNEVTLDHMDVADPLGAGLERMLPGGPIRWGRLRSQY
jgi:catechol 2,3-dioxygenase-like lactoylglutathione lyase family enzyme